MEQDTVDTWIHRAVMNLADCRKIQDEMGPSWGCLELANNHIPYARKWELVWGLCECLRDVGAYDSACAAFEKVADETDKYQRLLEDMRARRVQRLAEQRELAIERMLS